MECERAQAHVLALRACTEGQIKIVQKELTERENNLQGESSDSDYDLKKRKECSLIFIEELKNKLAAEVAAKEALFSLNFVLLSDIRKCKLNLSDSNVRTSENTLSKIEAEKLLRSQMKEKEKEKEREKDKEIYKLKSKNVPGAADIPEKEDSSGSDINTKSARTDLRRASVSGETTTDPKNVPGTVDMKNVPSDIGISPSSLLIRRASMGGWKNNEVKGSVSKSAEKGKSQVVGGGGGGGGGESIKDRIKHMKAEVKRKALLGNIDNVKERKLIINNLELVKAEFKAAKSKSKFLEIRERGYTENENLLRLEVENAEKEVVEINEKIKETTLKLEESRKGRKEYDVIITTLKNEIKDLNNKKSVLEIQIEETKSKMNLIPSILIEKNEEDKNVVRLSELLNASKEKLRIHDSGNGNGNDNKNEKEKGKERIIEKEIDI